MKRYTAKYAAHLQRIERALNCEMIPVTVVGLTLSCRIRTAGEQCILADAIDFERNIYGEDSVIRLA